MTARSDAWLSNGMPTALILLLDRLDSPAASKAGVIQWGCPVPSFGDLSGARVATVGLNPSNREFVDEFGRELEGPARRFHTLTSLRLRSWSEADSRHLRLILASCAGYFLRNPYDTWFRKLDEVVSGAKASFYDPVSEVCHLDLIPYATRRKWTELTASERSSLLALAGDTLGLLLRKSEVRFLILNGRSVVEEFQEIAGIRLDREVMPSWSLPRKPQSEVRGIAYQGSLKVLSGIRLPREILVLGYNHNLQSSFGVTRAVIRGIREWISRRVDEATT